MEKQPGHDTVGYCLDSMIGNFDFIEKRLRELHEEMSESQEFPPKLRELADMVERRFQKVNNLMVGLPFPRI